MLELTPKEYQSLRRALQIARAHLEHEVRNWEYPPNAVLEDHVDQIRHFGELLRKIDQNGPITGRA